MVILALALPYLKYLSDASTLVVPIDRPCKLDYKEHSLSEKFWF